MATTAALRVLLTQREGHTFTLNDDEYVALGHTTLLIHRDGDAGTTTFSLTETDPEHIPGVLYGR